MTRAESRLILTGAARRRVFGEYQASPPSRFLDEIPAELVDRIEMPSGSSRYQGGFSHAHYEFRTNPYGRKGRGTRFREEPSSYAYEDEDQSTPTVRPGMRVRHAQFGIGTVLAVEEHNDDLKITVRFRRRAEEAAGEIREARAGLSPALRRPPFGSVRVILFVFPLVPSFATDTTMSPSSISMRRTPWVARPIVRMPPAFIRRIIPCWLISMS